MRAILGKALATTESAWPEVRRAFGWVHQAAAILGNEQGLDGVGVRRRLRGLLGAIARHGRCVGSLDGAIGHLLKVTRSYWAGLFACYDTKDLPRTNNDLEQLFGSYRYHERRASGRRVASPGMVVRGSVRLVSATASRLHVIEAADLAPADLASWRCLRAALDRRALSRTWGRRFRQSPKAYLQSLEATLIKSALPS